MPTQPDTDGPQVAAYSLILWKRRGARCFPPLSKNTYCVLPPFLATEETSVSSLGRPDTNYCNEWSQCIDFHYTGSTNYVSIFLAYKSYETERGEKDRQQARDERYRTVCGRLEALP